MPIAASCLWIQLDDITREDVLCNADTPEQISLNRVLLASLYPLLQLQCKAHPHHYPAYTATS